MSSDSVTTHYARTGLSEAIRAGLESRGIDPTRATIDDLGPVDEFHVGGRAASREVAEHLDLAPDLAVLDVGCGLGGPARFLAREYGCRVIGIDLTPEYIDAARTLTEWLGLGDAVDFHVGSALEMPFGDASFDRGLMVHVGMNIADKRSLFQDIARVLRPGGVFGVCDIMRRAEGPLTFPVPWAGGSESSFVEKPEIYAEALEAAGFAIIEERDRHAFAIEFFDAQRARQEQMDGLPPVGLHLLMGESAPTKLGNMVKSLRAGAIGPYEIYARKVSHQRS